MNITGNMEIECRIEGKVQGVRFREYAKSRADELGLSGIARNLPDGSVEVIAQGGKTELEELLRLLKKGPVFSRVDDIEVDWHDGEGDPMIGFSIE